MATLEWNKLLCTKRERESKSGSSINPVRNEFEADYDRIVGSSSVRRLQDKAQVFPLQQNDVARTRLTHSMEVSALARSLGKAVGRRLEEKEIFQDREQTEKLSALLQVAGLIHDLGNPPFGHYGETVIRDWFGKWFNGDAMLSMRNIVLSTQQKNDFIYFDGNVQNLRIVTKLQVQNDNKGANFTYGTLATIMKYPWSSESRPKGKIKFGYFESEQELAEAVRREIGLEAGVRHPATYLLEAADDIIYICDDIEDGTKKGYIEWKKEFETLYQKAEKGSYGEEIEKLLFNVKRKNDSVDSRMHDKEQVIAYVRNFRNMVQSFLFKKVVDQFMDQYERIMSNDPKADVEELLSVEREFVKDLKNITARQCFSSDEVLNLELTGDKVISTLLDVFVRTLTEHDGHELSDTRTYAGKIFRKISRNFIYIAESKINDSNYVGDLYSEDLINKLSVYDRLHLVVDYVSGMTDSYAVKAYQELTAMKHP